MTGIVLCEDKNTQISTHTSLAGRDKVCFLSTAHAVISTHTSLAGRDGEKQRKEKTGWKFLLTRPSRDVTKSNRVEKSHADISTHTSLAGRDCYLIHVHFIINVISTHTSLAGRDNLLSDLITALA